MESDSPPPVAIPDDAGRGDRIAAPPRPVEDRPRLGPERGAGREGSGEPRRRRGGERRAAGFGDGIERAVCAAVCHVPPPAYPVQHRGGAATLRPHVVDRRSDAVLLCDGGHPGLHRWPDGEPVEIDTGQRSSIDRRGSQIDCPSTDEG